jgi:predicted TIM-barrel fold metal-dependent hydrolase
VLVPPGGEPAIVDSHCHAWRRWPYAGLVPDEDHRGTIDQLLYEMDVHGVATAVLISAAITSNPDNLEYLAFAVGRYPDRLRLFADVDCEWSTTYHQPGSAGRLRDLDDRYPLSGFTHYVAGPANDGWLASDEADQLFAAAAERDLVVSLSAGPRWQRDLRALAQRHPSVPVLCNHLGSVRSDDPEGVEELLESAAVGNILLKVSGFHYAAARFWDYPWPGELEVFRRLYDRFGPHRLCWGSDFPAARWACTYRQSLEAVRTHCDFLSPDDLGLVLGGSMRRVLETRRPPP